MIVTSLLFFVYYSKIDMVQRRNDKNRIENLKSAMELEDIDFMKMVNDLKLDYDESDLRDFDKEIVSHVKKVES
mgnify:CR=1 FL=1